MSESTARTGTTASGQAATNGNGPYGEAAQHRVVPAEKVSGQYAAELCGGKLSPAAQKYLAGLSVIEVRDLKTVRALNGSTPTKSDVQAFHDLRKTSWNPDRSKSATLAEVKAAVAGVDPTKKVALATLITEAQNGVEYAVKAVKVIRDLNVSNRGTGGRRRTLVTALDVGSLLLYGATTAEVTKLGKATRVSTAASTRMVEKWDEEDHREDRSPGCPDARITLTKVSKVERRHVEWLWRTRYGDPNLGEDADLIPLHGLTLIAGREQAAKSTCCWWLTAQVTRGLLPGRYYGQPRDVVILASEDSEIKIRLRLEAAGADLDRVHLPVKQTPDGVTLPLSIKHDMDALTELLTSIECGLIILDPLKDFMGAGVNTDREDEVRPVLTKLLEVTERLGAAVVGLIHLNKSTKGDFLTRLSGSGAFKNVARAVHGVAEDSDTGTRVFQMKKSNDGELPRQSLQGRVIGVEITAGGVTEKVGKWVMDGSSPTDLDAALAAKENGHQPKSKTELAKGALTKLLGDGTERPSDDVKAAVMQQTGVSERTIKSAFSELRGTYGRTAERHSRTTWSLPKGTAG